ALAEQHAAGGYRLLRAIAAQDIDLRRVQYRKSPSLEEHVRWLFLNEERRLHSPITADRRFVHADSGFPEPAEEPCRSDIVSRRTSRTVLCATGRSWASVMVITQRCSCRPRLIGVARA